MSDNRTAASIILLVRSIFRIIAGIFNLNFIKRSLRRSLVGVFSSRQLFTKLMSFIIISSMLANSTPAAPLMIWSSLNNFGQDIRYAYLTSPTLAYFGETISGFDLTNNFVFAFFFKGNKQEAIARIEISPNGATIREGEDIYFTAAAYDQKGNLMQGVKFNWTAQSRNAKSPLLNLPNGKFAPQFYGGWVVTAQTGNSGSEVVINVKRDDAAIFGKELRQQKENEGKQGKGTLRPTKINKNQPLPELIQVSSQGDSLVTARQKNESIKTQKRNLLQPDGKDVVGLKVNCSPDSPYYPDCGYEEADNTKKKASVGNPQEEGGGKVLEEKTDKSVKDEEYSQQRSQNIFQIARYSKDSERTERPDNRTVSKVSEVTDSEIKGKKTGSISDKVSKNAKSKNGKKSKGKTVQVDLSSMIDPNCPTGYVTLGGGLLGTPTTGVLGSRLMVFVRGTDNVIYWKFTDDGSNFSNWLSLGGGTYENPRTLVSNGTLYLEVTGTDNNKYYKSTNDGGNNWNGWISGTVNAQTSTAATFLGNTYNFTAGTGSPNPLCVSSSGGGCNVNGYDPTYGWNNLNYLTADDPGQQPTGGAGSSSFSFSAPVLSLGGRGDLGVNLSLNYNSLLWHKANGEMVYDIDKGFPAPGWSIGFGKMMDMGSGGGSMIEDPSGARHSYDGVLQNYYGGYSNYQGRTIDGSFIDYTSYRTPAGISGGVAHFPNGTTITYGAASDGVAYPTRIEDRHGNFQTISYCNNVGPKINNVTDNLNRTIQFNYSGNKLVSITGPGFNGVTKTFVRIHYKTLNLTGTFTGSTVKARTSTPDAIDAIYYPDTNTGYWFGDENSASPSYSPYGMLMKVSERKNITWAANQTDPTAVGEMTRETVYSYPTAPSALADAPKYSTMTEDWLGREPADTNLSHPATPTAVTQYSIVSNPTSPAPRTTTITLPNGNRVIQYSKNEPNALDDGLLYRVETLPPTTAPNPTTPLSVMETDWEPGFYNNYRPKEVRTTDEKEQTTKQTFAYTYFNLVTEAAEYGYKDSNNNYPLLRKTVSSYEHTPEYSGVAINDRWSYGNHLFEVVKTREVYSAGNVRLSKTDFNYDTKTLMNTLGVLMYDQTHNPYTTEFTDGACLNWEYFDPNDPDQGMYCTQYDQVPNFDQATLYRGNLTETKSYPDAANPTPASAIIHLMTYDITGNTRTATTDCCEQMSFAYSTQTQYSQPDSHTKGGGSSSNQNTESATYDIYTGLVKTSTDFNNQTTNYYYDAANRPIVTVAATQAKSETVYDDANLKVTQTAYKYNSPNNYSIIGQSTSFANGRGQVVRSESLVDAQTNEANAAVVKYDELGRKKYASMPFRVGENPSNWTTYHYDVMSRVDLVTAPDSSQSRTFYNEALTLNGNPISGQNVRSQDAWGRERLARTDAFGRLIEVYEPNPAGNGSVLSSGFAIDSNPERVTSYGYDALDQLTQVNQGDQVRKFAYDSLGRLTRQKLAEQANTIEGQWSDKFVYDNRSNLVERTDARGVKTTFNYNSDPLNRLQSISYDKTNAINPTTIADAGMVTISYVEGGDKSRVETVTTAATGNTPAVTEYNHFNSLNQIDIYTLTIGTKSPLTSEYEYDSAYRLTKVKYPLQYGTSNPNDRKIVEPTYDNASRLKDLKVNTATQLSDIVYNELSQVKSLRTGAATNNADIEQYSYDSQTGLLTGQQVIKQNTSQPLLDLSYNYNRGNSKGSLNGKTGQLTNIVNNLDRNKDRVYEFDTLGRLTTAKGGIAAGGNGVANWTQGYTFDRYGNRTSVTASGVTANNATVPTDGLASLSYQTTSNRIINTNYEYDSAGNQTRGQSPSGTFQRFDYDAAGRLVTVKDDNGTPIESYAYGASRQRLRTIQGSLTTYYAWGGSSVLCEYTENNGGAFTFSKSYIYAGSRLLSTQVWNGSTETTEFHHPDRLGTKLVTNNAANTFYEQSTLPFGTSLDAEFIGTPTTNQRFTSYDRSQVASLDYAVNRSYSSGQGRFTTVDPIGFAASSVGNPQSNNLYAYTENNPVDFTDPSGLLLSSSFCVTMFDAHYEYRDGQIVFVLERTYTVCYGGGYGGVTGGGLSQIQSQEDIEKLPESLLDKKVAKIPHPDKKGLEAALDKRLAQGKCGEMLNALLQQLNPKSSKSIKDVANKFFNDKGYKLLQTKDELYDFKAKNAQGKWEKTSAFAGETSHDGKTIVLNKRVPQINNFIHELIHAAGISTHSGANFEDEANKAIRALEGNGAGAATSINNFLGKYCNENPK